MNPVLTPPAKYIWGVFPAWVLSAIIPLIGICIFAYLIALRSAPLARASADPRSGRPAARFRQLLVLWLFQKRQPRYMVAGILHIVIFAGFLALGIRSVSMVVVGIYDGFVLPGLNGVLGDAYGVVKDYAATLVLLACLVAAVRRGLLKPSRYAVPQKYGKSNTAEAVFVLTLISALMLAESLFDGSQAAAAAAVNRTPAWLPPLSLTWLWNHLLRGSSPSALQGMHLAAYYIHDLAFFFFLCFLPFGKHFHVITSIFNVYFMRLRRGNIKPVRHGVSDEQLDDLESFGVKQLEDFTWKHILFSIFIPARTAGGARTIVRPMPPAGRCRRGLSPSRAATWPSANIR